MSGLCYVLPKYDANSEEHFFHIYSFLEMLGKRVPLAVIAERSAGRVEFPSARMVYGQRFTKPPLRWMELFLALCAARLKGFNLLYVHYSYWACMLGFLTHRLTGGKTYYWNCGHSSWFFKPFSFRRENLVSKFAIEWPLRVSIALCNRLVTGTKRMAEYYNREFGKPENRMVVVPNEVNLERFRNAQPAPVNVPKGSLKVLFLHRLSPRKGAHLLPSIIASVARQVPDSYFIIAGDGPSRKEVEDKLRDCGLADRVKFLGWVKNREVPQLMRACDVYIMPSPEEGFPRVLIEAMAAGIPFVASDVGGVRDITTAEQQEFLVAKRGFDVPPGEFADAVVRLLKDTKKRAKLSAVGGEWVKQYGAENVIEVFINKLVKG